MIQGLEEIIAKYKMQRRREIEESHATATLLGFMVFPAFALLDALTQKETFVQLILVRIVSTAVFGIAYVLALYGIRPGGVTVTATTLLMFASISISIMCILTGGFASPYYAGINLLILTCVTFPPGTFKQTIGACAGIVVTYGLCVWWLGPSSSLQARFVINNLLFIGATCAIGISTALFQERLRFVAFKRLLEAEDTDLIRKAHAAMIKALGLRDEFISIASHELRTPITSMQLQNDIVKRDLNLGPVSEIKLKLWVTRNARLISRLTRLVEDMLDVGRINTGRLKIEKSRMDLSECVQEAAEKFALQFEQFHIRTAFYLQHNVIGNWDSFRIEQVIANLFSNAVKYAPHTTLEVRVESHQGQAWLRVIDHGDGIKSENIDRIFDRFERAHPPTGTTGLGLGLYISKKIVEAHKGKIWAEPSEGGGSTFVVCLPLLDVKVDEASHTINWRPDRSEPTL